MASIKEQAKQLEEIIDQQSKQAKVVGLDVKIDATDIIPELEPTQLFEYEPDKIKNLAKGKAKQLIKGLSEMIFGKEWLKSIDKDDYIKTKIAQDIETFTDLFVISLTDRRVYEIGIQSMATQGASPRFLETIAVMSKKCDENSSKLLTVESALRSEYIKLKSQYESTRPIERVLESGETNQTPKVLESKDTFSTTSVHRGSKTLIEMVTKRKKDSIKNGLDNKQDKGYAEYEEVK